MKLSPMVVFAILSVVALLSSCATPTDTGTSAPEAETVTQAATETDPDTAPIVDEAGYRLGQGDRISIQVFDEPDLTLQATVGSRGGINYSYLGDLRVAGKTPGELERHIADLLRDGYLVNPSVNVSIEQFRPFFIGGEVRSPGSYPYQPGLTLDKAIALAGGLTDRASVRQIYLVKAGSRATDERKVNLSAAVEPGDTVTIKEGFF